MKKILLLALAVVSALPSFAELNGNGYYRLQNALTKRYTYLMDNKGSVDVATSSADVGALELYTGFLRASSDPATVFYLENHSGSEYNVRAQGTDLYTFLEAYLKLLKGKEYDGQVTYYAYASKSGLTKYIGDIRSDNSNEKGYPSADAKGDTRLWYINPLTTADDNYFGVAPTVTAGGKYYYPMYAGFPYSAHSPGVRFYVVSKIAPEYGVAVLSEVKGTVPASVPVIIECEHPLATDNRLAVGAYGSGDKIPSNCLKGVYFDNPSTNRHHNQTPYDSQSMRSLAVVDGKLMFVKGGYEFCPRNESYLSLPAGDARTVDSYQVMKEDEFNAYVDRLSKLNPDGYCRMRNASTKRFAFLLDNKGSASDLKAVSLASDLLKASSDPAAVMYMAKPASGSVFDRTLSTQSTSTSRIFGSALSVTPSEEVGGKQAFKVAVSAGNLGDAGGSLVAGASGDADNWWFDAVNAADDTYFGIAPTVTAGGKYYHPFMADFPVAAYSPDVKFYIVSKVDYEASAVVLRQVEGVIPRGKAVIVECAGPLVSDNRLVVGAQGEAADLTGNLLGGVYFDNSDAGHVNRTAYDRISMRSLTSVGGKLMFAPADMDYLPRNQAYLRLINDYQTGIDSYSVMTEDEYQAYCGSAQTPFADGYYRIRNAATGRSMYMADNSGSIPDAYSADFAGIRMADSETLVSDPASVFNFRLNVGSLAFPIWSVSTQNNSFVKITGANLKTLPSGEKDGMKLFDTYIFAGKRKVYLADRGENPAGEAALAASPDEANRQWIFNEVKPEDDENCFGLFPTVQYREAGRYFRPFAAEFPFRPYSEGMKVYILTKIDADNAAMVIKRVEGSIPANTPVIVECAGPDARDNRIEIVTSGMLADVAGNLLSAVWFDSDIEGHVNSTPYDSDAMRMLAFTSGQLSFVKTDALKSVPRNQAFAWLSGDAALAVRDYKVLTEEEYAGLHSVDFIPGSSFVDVYSADGMLIRRRMPKSEAASLPRGLYLLRAGEAVEKRFVN